MSRFGCGRSSITVVAASSVGLSIAVNENNRTRFMRGLVVAAGATGIRGEVRGSRSGRNGLDRPPQPGGDALDLLGAGEPDEQAGRDRDVHRRDRDRPPGPLERVLGESVAPALNLPLPTGLHVGTRVPLRRPRPHHPKGMRSRFPLSGGTSGRCTAAGSQGSRGSAIHTSAPPPPFRAAALPP